jgi:mitochondrial ornithine carrier protein
MAENATLFFTYHRAQQFFKSSNLFLTSNGDISIWGLVAAGGIAGACTSYVLTPIELVKCKLQVQNVGSYTPGTTTFPSSASTLKRGPLPVVPSAAIHTSTKAAQPGPLQLVRQIYRAQGITGFWRGQMGTFLRETGGSAAWFGTYEYVSSLLKASHPLEEVSSQEQMIGGACAGMAYNLVLFPADSVKSRMQTDAISDGNGTRGFWEVGKEMWKHGGVRVFYRGCLITVLRAAPASAVIFWTYESMKKWVSAKV